MRVRIEFTAPRSPSRSNINIAPLIGIEKSPESNWGKSRMIFKAKTGHVYYRYAKETVEELTQRVEDAKIAQFRFLMRYDQEEGR